ncbi:hypothetical protein YTPLAS73_07210 [Nitrosarchaeum sp.]|nr:hypothetical protein YTPLAS73_07210 [Nitrosarchaeum sp.]
MTLKGKQNHYNVKFLKGFGFSIKVKDSKIVLTNTAYPYAITQIPDLSDGRWIKRKTIHKDAKVGFFRIRAKIPDCKYILPFPFRTKHDIVFPSGEFETYVTLQELLVCEKSFYKILEGYQFIPNSNSYPYAGFISKLYQKRLELKQQNNPLQLPIKIILNSIYGKTGQVIEHNIGNMFNPVIFAFITGFVRAQLYSFVKKYGLEKEVVFFATDSICTRNKLKIDSAKLGDFSFDGMGDDVFVLQNGFYRLSDTDLSLLEKADNGESEFCLGIIIQYYHGRNTASFFLITKYLPDLQKFKTIHEWNE